MYRLNLGEVVVHSSWNGRLAENLAFGEDMGMSLFGFEHDKTFMGLNFLVFLL